MNSDPMFLVCSGFGLLLFSYLLGILRWRQFARTIIAKQRFRAGFGADLNPPSLAAPDQNQPEILYDEMIVAGRRLQDALDREQTLRRTASKGLNQVSASIERETRELVDSAAANYLQATQRLRASVLTIGIERKMAGNRRSFRLDDLRQPAWRRAAATRPWHHGPNA